MAKRILVVPDVHGRTFWKEPVGKYIDLVDKIVFLGDYLDPYNGEEGIAQDIFLNLMNIVDLKLCHPDKVVLLKGNHDEHYSSRVFRELAGGSRMDELHWDNYHVLFNDYGDLFKIAHLETVHGIPYLFTHAGITVYWLNVVNSKLWHLNDNEISVADEEIVERINALDTDARGQALLSVVGRSRSWFGEKTGSVLWADIEEHSIPDAPKAYSLDKVFQVFGHTKLNKDHDMIEFDDFAMIDSRQCFMIDEGKKGKIVPLKDYKIHE